MEKWITTGSKYIFKTPYGNMRADTCRVPDGRIVDEYHVYELDDWVNIVAIDKSGNLVLANQYRQGAQDIFLELVAGAVEKGEPPEDAIVRELQEETGYVCLSKPVLLGKFHFNPAMQDNMMYMFFCDNIEKSQNQNLDEFEDIEVVTTPFIDIDKHISDGTISTLSSVTAIELAKKYMNHRWVLSTFFNIKINTIPTAAHSEAIRNAGSIRFISFAAIFL